MRNKILTSIAAAASLVALAVSPALAWQSGGGQGGGNENKVTLCHATDSNTNPYVQITVAAAGAYHGHYSEHQGPVYPGSGGKWGDIIPPFTYQDHSYSLNWDASGQAIYNNTCKPVGGSGGGQNDCDNDFDNSPSTDSECTPQPQKDCDNDFDNSPASECPSTGGMGGGGDTTTTTTPTVTSAASVTTPVTGGRGSEAAQVQTPTGGVGAGEGGAAFGTSVASLFGLVGSLSAAGYGMRRLSKQQG